jgi:hypothetical protein
VPGDCGSSVICGDLACDPGETFETCPSDCARMCDFEPSGIEQPISEATETVEGAPSIALDRSVWWIAWIGRDAMTMVSQAHLAAATSGAVSTRTLAMDTPVQGISVAALGGVVAVAWIDASGNVVLTIRSGLVTEVLPPTPIGPAQFGTALEPDPAGGFVLSWASTDGIHVARFSLDGVASGPQATIMGIPASAPSLEPGPGAWPR